MTAQTTMPLVELPLEPLSVLPSSSVTGRGPTWLTWQRALTIIWLSGTSAWLGVFLIRLKRFRRLAGFASPASPEDCRRVAELAARIGLRKAPVLRLVHARVPPMTWGFGRRHEMLVPAYLWNTLPASQRDALVLHELAHLRRGDHWVRQFELLVFVLHWWHPVSWWARHELQKAEEECCDAWVVRGLPNIAGDYAELIVETIAYLAQPPTPELPPLASGLGHIRHVRKRLAAILGGSAAPRLSLIAWAGIAAIGIFLLPVIPTTSKDAQAGGLAGLGYSIDDGSLPTGGTTHGLTNTSNDFPSVDLDPLIENLTILQLQLIQRQAELTEEKLLLEQARRTSQRGTALVARGAAARSVLEESLTDQSVREARVQGREAAVQELKLRIKREELHVNRERQKALARSNQQSQAVEKSMAASAPPGNISFTGQKASDAKRIDQIEHRLDGLIAEARALADELRRESSSKD